MAARWNGRTRHSAAKAIYIQWLLLLFCAKVLSGGGVTAPTLRGTRETVILGGHMPPLISRSTLERCAFLLLLFTNKVLAGGVWLSWDSSLALPSGLPSFPHPSNLAIKMICLVRIASQEHLVWDSSIFTKSGFPTPGRTFLIFSVRKRPYKRRNCSINSTNKCPHRHKHPNVCMTI